MNTISTCALAHRSGMSQFRVQIFQMRILREQQRINSCSFKYVTNVTVQVYLMNAVSFFHDIAKTNERPRKRIMSLFPYDLFVYLLDVVWNIINSLEYVYTFIPC